MTEVNGPANGRPDTFEMPIQGGILEALGINMYNTLGKCLVEFISNAYDGDASRVDITIPVDDIASARQRVRAAAKKEVDEGTRDPFTILLAPLPIDVQVTIKDDGHGMTWEELRDKFLPLNRKRRVDDDGKESRINSESGQRYVIGRKGLGKLAGFGAAESITVTSKRKGDSYLTQIAMDGDTLKNAENLAQVEIPVSYTEQVAVNEQGTEIVLSGLKADAVRHSLDTLKRTITEAFYGIRPQEFSIVVNGDVINSAVGNYVVTYPPELDDDGFAEHSFHVDDIGNIAVRYFVGFREQSLPARNRGARIYCNHRLAAGPSLFDLPTGMHSFHSSDYMECIVEADELDRHGVDFINTNRTQLREDTDVVRVLLEEVSELMRLAIPLHARYRQRKAEEDIQNDPKAKLLKTIVEQLPKKTRRPAYQLLTTLAAEFGVGSDSFQELAPVVTASMNATEVLVGLAHLKAKPETIAKVARHLSELSEIERGDALKLYRARRNGIAALQALWETGEEEWRKRGIEKELHNLVKKNPWLIRPELSTYLTSDRSLQTVVSKAAKALSVDEFVEQATLGDQSERRPDLVFVMSDPSQTGPHIMNVVELKSPTIALNIDHYRQLEDYISELEHWVRSNLGATQSVALHGFLLGTVPPTGSGGSKERQLLEKFNESGPHDKIRILSLTELLRDALSVHVEAIQALESEEEAEADSEE